MTQSIPFPNDPAQEVRLTPEQLTPVLEAMFVKKSMFQFDASVAVKRMLEADLYGIPSHGAGRICEYIDAIDLGDIDPRARVLVLHENDVMTMMDGSRSIGHVAATKAIESASAKAKSSGVGVAALSNSQTLGAASVYVRLAVEQGLIAICMSSTGGATVAAPGTKSGAVGNAAFSYGVPIRNGAPVIFDSACGASSWGKLRLLEQYGLPVPAGIAFDEQGEEATTFEAAKVLQSGGKELGYGLSLLCSILAGPLSVGRMPIKKTRSDSAEDSQHFFIVFDISSFQDPERFQKQLNAGLDEIRELPSENPGEPVRIPGDRSQQCFQNYSQNGIPFHRSTIDEIRARAEQLGVVVEW